MNEERPTLVEAVDGYYAANELPADRLQRLVDLHPQRRTYRRWVAAALATAGILVALAFTVGVERSRSAPAARLAAEAMRPGLVAVQIHADWCPRSPSVAPIFGELLTRYGNQSVLFVTLDITDDVRRGQAELLAESLGIVRALDEPFGSGMIKLIDRDNDVLLASITGREDSPEFEIRLAEFLDRRDRPRDGT